MPDSETQSKSRQLGVTDKTIRNYSASLIVLYSVVVEGCDGSQFNQALGDSFDIRVSGCAPSEMSTDRLDPYTNFPQDLILTFGYLCVYTCFILACYEYAHVMGHLEGGAASELDEMVET